MTGIDRYTSAHRRSLRWPRRRVGPNAARSRTGVIPWTIAAVILRALVPSAPAVAQFENNPNDPCDGGTGFVTLCDPSIPTREGQCDDDNPCTDDSCEAGGCEHECLTGPPCSDFAIECDAFCDNGKCVIDCDDGDPCTADACEWIRVDPPFQNCVHEAIDCNDYNVCTDDECIDGVCYNTPPPEAIPCDDEDACTENDLTCEGSNDECVGTDIDCEDDDLCTTNERCDPAIGCLYDTTDCDDDDPCTTDTCDPQTGDCEHEEMWPPLDTCQGLDCFIDMGVPARLYVNNDDDNHNGVPDLIDPGPVQGEDDLVSVAFDVCVLPGGAPECGCDPLGFPGWWQLSPTQRPFAYYLSSNRHGPLADEMPQAGPPPATLYAEGREGSSACGTASQLLLLCHCKVHWCLVRSSPTAAVQVGNLQWQKPAAYPDNPGLGNCDNNGGTRIFPGKISPNDPSPADRRQVDLVATVDPPIAGLTVYFKVWDVDDPFDQLNPDMPDVGLIDNDTNGPDNRPDGESAWIDSDVTDENGEARVTFTVSMQPGNNYRAGASLLQDALTQAPTGQTMQDVADAFNANGGGSSGYSVPLTWSPMLTVWRKLHVETDTMVRPTFPQNTFTMAWNEPREGAVSTQVVFDVDDPPAEGGETDEQQFTQGYVELRDGGGNPIVTARILDYVSNEGPVTYDDAVTINLPDCGGGQSGMDCLGGVENGNATFSDDDISDEGAFTAKVWGCDDAYSGPVASLSPPNLSSLQERYQPAYIDPVHDADSSAVQGLVTFLRNQAFGILDNYGKALWDQALAARNLPVSTSDFWTAMVVSAWQAEQPADADPNSEDQVGDGVTKAISTHGEVLGFTGTTSSIGPNYTGVCAVFKGVFGEVGFSDYEKFTVVHEIGHTFGLDHRDVGAMCRRGDCQREPFLATEVDELREYIEP